jgi:DNA-binding beta-propeller fold protein YncE
MKTLRKTLPFALALAGVLSGCVAGIDGSDNPSDDDGGDGGDDAPPPPPPVTPPPPPPPAVVGYKRLSMPPIYQLTPRAQYDIFTQKGVEMSDADFEDNGGDFVPVRDKIVEIEAQIAIDNGTAVDIFKSADDENRARLIPFRGNPSDLKLFKSGNLRKAFVPLGGDFMTPGNEVAAVNLDNGSVQRIKVGIRPQRVAVAGGLVFVANQFSNYISIIDPETNELLENAEGPVEIKTELYGTDLLLVPKNIQVNDGENFWLYVANNWRGSVLKYGIRIVKSGINDDISDVIVTDPVAPSPDNQPAAEITGVGKNPYRLALSQDQRSVYVANNRGGELAQINIANSSVIKTNLGSHTGDVIPVNDKIFVPTMSRDRGYPERTIQSVVPQIAKANAVVLTTANGPAVAHPGSQFDDTVAYNFEDVRNGLYQLNANLKPERDANNVFYFTDDNTPEPTFNADQKILAGASAQGMVVNAARSRAFIAHSGSDLVQEVQIRGGNVALADIPNAEFATEERPWALALDEDEGVLLVANWGGETLEVFSLQNRQRIQRIDLGYAIADYPATNMERGEYFFYNADWSNNGDKACAVGCHWDELLVDGFPYGNGATSSTMPHKVIANFNQTTTDSFFWNGSFKNGSYASLASDAQTRSNCELILFGQIEGFDSDPNDRDGDPANRMTVDPLEDEKCRPNTNVAGILPDNFDVILGVIADAKIERNRVVQAETGFVFDDVSRLTDFYSASEIRLPPNPVAFLLEQQQLSAAAVADIERGETLFTTAGCGNCHDPLNIKAPFTDGKEHGKGSDWRERFIAEYDDDPRLAAIVPGGVPDIMKEALSGSVPDDEINIHLDPIAYFVPFCFDTNKCLMFEDPLAAKGNDDLETDRLNALALVNLANVDRQFMPGNVRGQPMINTPSLRGRWWENNFLHHGFANSIAEAILPPGHSALPAGGRGYAIDRFGKTDVHGATSRFSADDVKAITAYILSIN